jgi:hypothetical protein
MIFAELADLFFFPPPFSYGSLFFPIYFLSLILFVLGHEQEVTNGTDQ